MAKGALYAEVEVAEGSTIHVFNTHLQSFYSLDHVEAHRVELLACLRSCEVLDCCAAGVDTLVLVR